MVFQSSLSSSKSLYVFRTLLSILADYNNAIVWMVSTHSFIFRSSCTNSLVTIPRAPITIGINVTFMFHSFFSSLARSRYLPFFSPSFNFILWSARTAKSTIPQILFIIIIIYSFRIFHISISRCFFTGFWVTTSLLKSTGLFSVFWPFSVMLSFG